MRYPAGEKLEIVRLVEQSSLPVRRTLEELGIPRATFYRSYDRCSRGGPEARWGKAWRDGGCIWDNPIPLLSHRRVACSPLPVTFVNGRNGLDLVDTHDRP